MSVRAVWARVLTGAVVAAPLAVAVTAAPAGAATTGVTSFSYVSHAGDYVGQGATGTLSNPDQFRISGTAGSVHVSIDNGSESWDVTLAAPTGQQLSTGVYENVARAPFSGMAPGLDVSSTGRGCTTVKGRFTIYAIGSDTSGKVTSLDASLTQFCDDSTGGLDATVEYAAPAVAPLVLTSSSPGTVADEPVTLTARVAPGSGLGISFVDGLSVIGVALPDAAGLARLTTSGLAVGTHTLTAQVGTTTSAPITQKVAAPETSLWFASQNGDYIGQGATASYVPPAATVVVTGTALAATVSVADSASGEAWSVAVAAPTGAALRPGTYTGATRAGFQGPGEPGLDVSGAGRGCNTLTGDFTVNSISTNPDGTVASLDVSFTQHCEGGPASLSGRARVNTAPTRAVSTTALSGGTTSDGAIGLTATVSGPSGIPTGEVTFTEDGATLGAAVIGGDGRAFFIVQGLPLGSHTLTASYGGSSTYLPSSASATFVLGGTATTTTFTAPKTAKVGKVVSLPVTVTSAAGTPPATGQVRLYDGAVAVGAAATLSAGGAIVSWTPTAKGQHSLTVHYLGDVTHLQSTSSVVVVKVN